MSERFESVSDIPGTPSKYRMLVLLTKQLTTFNLADYKTLHGFVGFVEKWRKFFNYLNGRTSIITVEHCINSSLGLSLEQAHTTILPPP